MYLRYSSERRRADAMQFAARERRLEHVARIDGAFRFARADHGVQLVDEDDGAAFVLRQFLEDGLQALLEFAAILGAGKQRRHVQAQDPLALERLGHFLVDDALGEAFDDRGLAHAGLADQHRIVLGPALQDLDDAADFVVAADDRIELARARALGQVEGVLLQCFALALGLLALHALPAAHGFDRPAPAPCG